MRITKEQLASWEKFLQGVEKETPVIADKSPADKAKRLESFKTDWESALRYYFPSYCQADFSKWQKRMLNRLINPPKTLYMVRKVHRDGAKTTLTQMAVLYMILFKRISNLLWVSKSQDAAMEMTRVLRLQLEGNARIKSDFGEQKNIGAWDDAKFVTQGRASVRAIGKGQSPRGAKEEEKRPDMIVCDDIDDDEEVLSETRLNKTWRWMMGALFGCFSVSGRKIFLVLNNQIAKDCLVERASKVTESISKTDLRTKFKNLVLDSETINLTDDRGTPTWPERFTKEECETMITLMGTHLANREYFNNPIIEGTVFKEEWLQFKNLPPLNAYRHLIAYLDPSFKNKKTSDHKALTLVGLYKGEYHIIKAYCGKASVNEMIEWHYDLYDFLNRHNVAGEFYMEEVFLQDLLYDDFNQVGTEKGFRLPIKGDTRKKPDKDARIIATSGDFQRGNTYFNLAEHSNHHMKELYTEFLLFEPGDTRIKKDGPDSYEGARWLLQQKVFTSQPPTHGARQPSKYRY